jgi:hypothetical protein
MHETLDELWLDALEIKVDEKVVRYLKAYHSEYQETLNRQTKLVQQYPIIKEVLEGDGCVSINDKEHRAFKEFMANRDDMERLEREYYYYFGQSHIFSYGQTLRSLQKEIDPDRNVPRKERLMKLLIEARTSDAELEFLKTDEEYQNRRNVSLQQEEILKAMNLPKEIMEQVDKVISSNSDHWSRYSDLIYQYAMQDILALLLE